MAITIQATPQEYGQVYNPLVFTVTSTNNTQCSFRYIADISVNGSFATRIKLFPDANGRADFKVNRVLEDYISFNRHNNLYGFTTNGSSLLNYSIQFGEEYDTTCGDDGTSVYSNLTASGTYYAWNGTAQYREWILTDFYGIFVATDNTSRFLTGRPYDGSLMGFGQQATFNILHTSNNIASLYVTVTAEDGSVSYYKIANSNTGFGTNALKMLSVGVGPQNLNNSTLSYGNLPIITDKTKKYSVQLLNGADSPVSAEYTFYMDKRVSKYPPVCFNWLNRFGGMDSYQFTLVNKRGTDISRTDYTKLAGAWNGVSGAGNWTYAIGDRGKTIISVKAVDNLSALSNWLTEEEALWMEDLFTSPQVFVQDVSNYTNCMNWTTGAYWSIGSVTCAGSNQIVSDGGYCGI